MRACYTTARVQGASLNAHAFFYTHRYIGTNLLRPKITLFYVLLFAPTSGKLMYERTQEIVQGWTTTYVITGPVQKRTFLLENDNFFASGPNIKILVKNVLFLRAVCYGHF